jgi:hypothetical protein
MDNGHEPATKADLVALEQRLTGDLTSLEQRITEAFTEAVRDSETRLLKAFYGFTESVQARFKAADDSEANLKKRLGVIEERLLEVEKKLNFPGH